MRNCWQLGRNAASRDLYQLGAAFGGDFLRASTGEMRRPAVTILEIVIATALLTALITMATQMMGALRGQQRAISQRYLALRTVQALAEQLGNTPFEELTQEAVQQLKLPRDTSAHLPNAQLHVTIEPELEPVVAKQATIELRWSGPAGRATAPARLTTWVFRDDEVPPNAATGSTDSSDG